jgi:hypothetical protein
MMFHVKHVSLLNQGMQGENEYVDGIDFAFG